MKHSALALTVLLWPALAMGDAPETAVLPVQKPAQTSDDVPVRAPEDTTAAPQVAPKASPKENRDAAPEPAPKERERTEESSASSDTTAQGETARSIAGCIAALDALGASYEQVEDVAGEDRECGFSGAVRLSEIVEGVKLIPPARLRCETALAMSRWVKDFVLPATDHLAERGNLLAIRQGSGFVCRRRNNSSDGPLSEHAFGTAIDVMSFEFDSGNPIPIQPRERDGTLSEAFQDAVRATACMTFSTVLGPGSDEYHDDHLHLDTKERNGGFRLCQ